MKLQNAIRAFAIGALANLAFAFPSHAVVVASLSAGTACGGGSSSSFSTSGPVVKVSLCITATTEAVCASTYRFLAANAGESGRFNITARALSANYGFSNVGVFTTPIPISNPATGDLGSGSTTGTPIAASPSAQLVATFDLAPQATATNASYVFTLDPATASVDIDQDGTCGGGLPLINQAISASFTLNLSAAPSFTSAAPAAGVVGTAYSHTFTATGSPAPTFSVTAGTLPAGLSLAAGGLLNGTPTAAGTASFTVTATNGVNPPANQAVMLTIAQASQTLTFPAQTTASRPFAPSGTFAISPLATGGASSQPIVYSSTTGTVCTVSGTTVTIVTAGTCTIAANRAGDANYTAAPQVTQSVAITTTAPGAPTGVTGSAGNAQGTVSFTAPANNGGSAITGYAVTCSPAGGTDTQTGTTSLSHLITGLANGTAYTCTVIATNVVGPGPASAASNAFTPSLAPVPPTFTSAANSGGSFTFNAPGTFSVTATGVPTPTITQTAGTLPTGVTYVSGGANSGTGTLSGTPTQAGTFNLTFTATGTAPAANQNFVLTVAKANQTITFVGPGPQTFSSTPVAVSATASSTLAVTFSSTTPAICSVSGTSVTMITVGTCTIAADQAGNANFNAAPQVTQSFVISQASQTITFGAQAPRTFSNSPQAINPLATATSGLPVTYSSTTPAVCTVSGSTFTSVSLGTCTIAANQAGNANYSAAPQVTQSFAITQGSQTIAFGPLPNRSLGTPPFTVTATASSGLAVSFASQTTAVCTTSGTNGSTVTMLILGTCTIQATQAGSANFAAATPVNASFLVVPPGAVTLTSSNNPASYRSSVVLTANISGTNPTGTVTFSVVTGSGLVTVCAAVPLAAASATCTVPGYLLVTNPTNFVANYSGDASNPANSTSFQQLVNMNSVTLTVVTVPIQPTIGSTVVLKAVLTGLNLTNKVAFNENGAALSGCSAVTVDLLPGTTDIGVASCTITGITGGQHNYVVTYRHVNDAGFEQVVVPITPVSGAADFTDMWWAGSAENGWGVSITQHGRAQFIVIYAYDGSGNPLWYVLPAGTWNASDTAFTGALYQPTSSPFSSYNNANSFLPGGATGASVGTATVTYTGSGTATLTYTINNVSGSKSIVRQPFGTDDGLPRLQVADMWWAGTQQNGWGMNIAQHARVLFPVWYTYNAQGRTTFYTVPGGVWTGSTFTGDIFSTVSSAWLGVTYNPAQLVVTKVGKMTLDFTDQSNAIMTYDVGGIVQQKVIVRQPYP